MKFIRNNKAVTAIEFALLAPVFFLIFYGIIEIGLTMFFDSTLDTALRAAARKGINSGYASTNDVRDVMDDFMAGTYRAAPDMVLSVRVIPPPKPNALGNIQISDVNAEIAAIQSFSTAFLASPDSAFAAGDNLTASQADQSGAIVIYMAKYKWGGVTQMVGKYLPSHLYAIAIVRNEVY